LNDRAFGVHTARTKFSSSVKKGRQNIYSLWAANTRNRPWSCEPCELCGWHEQHSKSMFPTVSHIQEKKSNFSAESKLEMCNLLHWCGVLRDMQSTVCWPNNKQNFHEMISVPR